MMCTVVENTGRVAAERRLAESEAELRIITDSLPVLVAFVDREERYRFANDYYREFLGTDPEGMLGQRLSDVLTAEDYAERRPLIERALAGKPSSPTCTCITATAADVGQRPVISRAVTMMAR
ncbi:hypothetical protein GCM10020258_41690 [Sphingomonas yabuuchiae]